MRSGEADPGRLRCLAAGIVTRKKTAAQTACSLRHLFSPINQGNSHFHAPKPIESADVGEFLFIILCFIDTFSHHLMEGMGYK